MSSPSTPLARARVRATALAIVSGKGGVGKSTVAANLAVALAAMQRRVLVLDADFGLASLDVLFGINPERTILHFFQGECALKELIVAGPRGVHLIPAASGNPGLARMDAAMRRELVRALEIVRCDHDDLLIDASSGIGENVVALTHAADGVIVVASPEPASRLDAYATIKILSGLAKKPRLTLLVNGADDEAQGRSVHEGIDRSCRRFLGMGIALCGMVPKDPCIDDAVRAQRTVVDLHPQSPASRSYRRLAEHVGSGRIHTPLAGPGDRPALAAAEPPRH